LREAGLRAEHVAFSFMKRRVQPLMARDTLGYQYTGDEDTSRTQDNEVDDEDIIERLGRIFEDANEREYFERRNWLKNENIHQKGQ
jgi:hypothetical protein